MMKKLLFMAALLVPGLAYAQNPTADLSLQVVPASAGIACDYGPNTTLPTGTAGTDLAASGFTHCVLNADFTDNSGATGGSGWVMNNLNTWLSPCKGTTAWGLFWLDWTVNLTATNGDNYSKGAAPCNRASLLNDGAGSQVLNYQFNTSDYVSGTTTGLALYWPLCGINSTCLPLAPAMPTAMYVELTYKLAAGLSQPASDLIVSLDSANAYDGDPTTQPGGWLDVVTLEALANNNPSTAWNFDNYGTAPACGGKCSVVGFKAPDLGNYHIYSNLVTTDAISNMSFCEYIDNAGISGYGSTSGVDGTYCGHIPSFTGANEMNAHNRRIMLGMGNSAGHFTSTVSIYVKSIRIFACASYRTGNCSGSVVWH